MKRVLLDTNLLVLYVVGLTDPAYIERHKRLRSYSRDDYQLLIRALSSFPALVVTPNVLSETSNLLRQFAEPGRSRICMVLKHLIHETDEAYVTSAEASDRTEYLRLGLADAASLSLQDDDTVLLTDDLDLYIASAAAGRQSINFSHLRDR